MGVFDDRKRGFEERFRHEQVSRNFPSGSLHDGTACSVKVADHLGLSGGEAEEYARSVVVLLSPIYNDPAMMTLWLLALSAQASSKRPYASMPHTSRPRRGCRLRLSMKSTATLAMPRCLARRMIRNMCGDPQLSPLIQSRPAFVQ
jgi:hypothetical protein